MRRLVPALLAIAALAAAPANAAPLQDFKNGGSIPGCKYSDKQLGGALGDLPPDIEQYAPGYAEQLRNARGAPCGGGGSAAGGGTTRGARERVQDVPAPPAAGGNDRGGGGSDPGSGTGAAPAAERIAAPPVPVPSERSRLAGVAAPAVTTEPTGPDVPTWVLVVFAAALLGGLAGGALFLSGADLSRVTRPFGVAAGGARERASDRVAQLWDTVRFGR